MALPTVTPSLDYYMKTLERAGLPMGDAKSMRRAQPMADFAIGDQVYSQLNNSPLFEERAAKVQKLADLDKRLSALYGKGGKLETDNPFVAEGALNTATSIAASDVGQTDAAIAQTQKDAEQTIGEISKFYSDLITETARQKAGTNQNINFEALIDTELGLDPTEYSDEDLQAILDEAGLN